MKKKNTFYYSKKNHYCDIMELNKWGYPVYQDSKKLVHRQIAKKYLLKEGETLTGKQVHHVDGDKLNYNPDNLVVLSKEDHKKISGRLNLETNLNKATTLILVSVWVLFVYKNQPNWDLISKIIFFGLLIAMLIPHYPDICNWIMKNTKLYKIVNYEK